MAHQEISEIVTKADVNQLVPDIYRLIADSRAGPRCNDGQGAGVGLSTCLCIHAEENALLEAGRERIREGSILYCDTYVWIE